jgi:hypothetical protein
VNKIITTCYRLRKAVFSVLLISADGSGVASSQGLQSQSVKTAVAPSVGSQLSERVLGYLHGTEPNVLLLLPPFPDSIQNKTKLMSLRFVRCKCLANQLVGSWQRPMPK